MGRRIVVTAKKTVISAILLYISIFVILFGSMLYPTSMATASPPLQSACENDYPPFCTVDSHNRAGGFSIELMQAALAAMKKEVVFKPGNWSEIKSWLEEGKIDVLPLVGRTEEREKTFDFTFPYLTMHGAIVTRIDSSDIRSMADLKNKKVAVMEADNAEEFLRKHYPDLYLIKTASFLDAFRILSNGGCDAVIMQRLVALRLIKESGIRNIQVINNPVSEFRQDFCFAVRESDKENLALLNEGLALIMADGTYQQLHSKWFASMELPESRNIIIGGDENYPPFEFTDADGKPAGLNVEITRAVARAVGLDHEIRLGPWHQITEGLEQGKIDAIQGLLNSTERDLKFDFSPPHTINHCVSVTRKGSGRIPRKLSDLTDLSILVQKGDIMDDYLRNNGLASNAIAVATQEEALLKLSAGSHDCALVARLTALYWIRKHKLDNLEVSDAALMSPEYGFAVQGNQKALLAKFAEGLKIIESNGELREIRKKWFGLEEHSLSMQEILRLTAVYTIPLLLIIMLSLAWTWTLRRKVALRTEELKQSATQFRSLIDGAPYAIFVQTDSCFRYLNRLACELFGAASTDQLENLPVSDRFHPEFHQSISARIHQLNNLRRSVPTVEATAIKLDKSEIAVEVSAVPINYDNKNGAMVFLKDITGQKKIEAQLRQAQKMEAVGKLAGGIAHDYNNMLSVILGYAEMAQSEIGQDSKALEHINEIINATKKAGAITSQLLTFARQPPVSPKIMDLNCTVADTLKMLRRLIGENIELVFESNQKPCLVKIDPAQLDQILTNLCINARDAINGIGTITISIKNCMITEISSENGMKKPGNYTMLVLADTGCGMTAAEIEKIFEPFFTTKSVGKGTGLGLATVYGIVNQNSGYIEVSSTPGCGSEFRIYLPGAIEKPEIQQESPTAAHPRGNGQIILIVEDDESILNLAKKIIEMQGYRVLTAASPNEALAIVSSFEEKITLLLTDVIMPGMNGRDLATQISALKPDIKCLFMSGYTAEVIAHRGVVDEGINFISKPFSMHGLARKIAEVIENH
jgi:two-component system sensor histidine kinase EvgS